MTWRIGREFRRARGNSGGVVDAGDGRGIIVVRVTQKSGGVVLVVAVLAWGAVGSGRRRCQ